MTSNDIYDIFVWSDVLSDKHEFSKTSFRGL